MAGTVIVGSPNISILDSKIVADLCTGKFFVDGTTSVFIGSGANNILGAKVQITNPYGVIIKAYGASYDIAAPITGTYEFNIPTQAGQYTFGDYIIELQITDADSTTHVVTKTVNVCTYETDLNDCVNAVRLVASCRNGTLTVYIAEPLVFRGKLSESKTHSWVATYPTGSGLAAFTSTNPNFSVQLFEGEYKVSGWMCAKYNMGDNVYVKLKYSGTYYKSVRCLLDYTCIYPKIEQLHNKINSDCSQSEKDLSASIVIDALRLMKTAELANEAGEDASPYIDDLETLLGTTCTSKCTPNAPIVNGTPSTNLQITGCNVGKTTVGLTDIYDINNYSYKVTVDPTQNIITISPPAQYGCEYAQIVSFSIANLYAGVKTQINSTTEYNYWAGVINHTLDGIVPACLGYSVEQWLAMTLVQRIDAIKAKACAGGSCSAIVTTSSTVKSGGDVVLSWTVTGAQYVQIWVDGDFIDAKASTITSITLTGYADGAAHEYEVRPICSNGVPGVPAIGNFTEIGCPTILPPNVSTTAASNVPCPYDLTGLVSGLPAGITAEWHNQNNTLSSTLVSNPASVINGSYWVFAKNADGCYSTGVNVTVTCQTSGTVTAPQNLLVAAIVGGLRISFESAAFPPPSNSYTVKRRLSSDPDISGSYTTLGSTGSGIAFNSSIGKWELTDTSALANTLYVYRAISNGGASPYVDYTFANLTCPPVTLTNTTTSISYSFTNVGGGVDKYVVELYDSLGTTLLQTQTILPAFATPITGTFPYLTAGTYKVRAKVYIGTYSTTCEFYSKTILSNYLTGDTSYSLAVLSGSGTIVVNNPAGAILTLYSWGGICGNMTFSVNVTAVGVQSANISSGINNDTKTTTLFIPQGTHNFTGAFNSACTATGSLSVSNP